VEPGGAVLDLDGFHPPLAFGRPRRIVIARALDEVRPALAQVDAAARDGAWAVGFVSYEAAPALDPALRTRPPGDAPLVWFGLHDTPAPPPAPSPAGARLGPLLADVGPEAYRASVERLRDAMARGVAYQVNHTFRLRGPFEGDPLALYQRLRAAQGGGLGACLSLDDRRAVVSASPELFFARRGRHVITRPMKGTARRGRFLEEDEAAVAALTASPKERAENVMIVDLLRNDLGKLAEPGSVRVAALCTVERYRTVLQMTSTVEATLRPGVELGELFQAAFPCGSVTGAPKASAMGLIAAEESSPRGVYCGAVGLVAPGGDAVFNVGIRTLWLDLERGEATAGVGGGITWDSSAAAEHDEALAKAAFLGDPGQPLVVSLRQAQGNHERGSERAGGTWDFSLLETLRLEAGSYPRLAGHLARLGASARYFGVPLDEPRVRAALAAEAAGADDGPFRVRLLLDLEGRPATERSPAPPPPAGPLPVVLAASPVSRRDPFLFHKTTRREPYDRARSASPEAFDVLLWNEEGEVTEFTIGNVVLELGGERVTPPRESGLLAGVLRAELLASGAVRERPVPVEAALRAERIWLVNALRGWIPVRLERRPPAAGV
jgi:para-aminobenzoate synthetase/4-amino-4-deoxychorismate lyase